MIKILILLSISSLTLAQNMSCLNMCHEIGMKRCLKKCAATGHSAEICHDACANKIIKPCQEKCQ